MRLRHQAISVGMACLTLACSNQDDPTAPTPTPTTEATASPNLLLGWTNANKRDLLTSYNGVDVYNSGYGSAVAMAPFGPRHFYLLTDRGPNVDFPNGDKGFPVPDYTPRIVTSHYILGRLYLDETILLRRADGTPLTGLPIGPGGCGSTGETAFTLDGGVIAPDPQGLDSEGLVVLQDGSFWVSDEYGPFMAKFDRRGREQLRWSPCNGGLPAVYATRRPNRGMEGLTITPDGKWLVGAMQAPLENPSSTGIRNISPLTRILFKNLKTGATREYAYILDDPRSQGNSEILALSNTRFLVLERDGNFLFGTPAAAIKRIYEIDISKATEINKLGALGATPVGGKTLEQATLDELLAAGIRPVSKKLKFDLVKEGYVHDKAEGLALAPGNVLFVSNDDDFGISTSTPGVMIQKVLPQSGEVDYVELFPLKLR
ncbi:MAG: esterase-like activity of phytase family protein [Gemmatimonadales bacterium]